MTTQVPSSNLLPLNPEQMARLQAATTDFTPTQLAWVSGYFWGVLNQHSGAVAAAPAQAAPVQTASGQAVPGQAAAAQAGEVQPGTHKLIITATEECWVHSSADKTDTRQFSLRKGDTFALTFSKSLELKLGNAGGVRLRYDGEELPQAGQSGQVRNLTFPPADRQ